MYSSARYLNQNDVLINRALKLCNSNSAAKTQELKADFVESKTLTLLEAAIIRTKQNRFQEAEKFALESVSLSSHALELVRENKRVDYYDSQFYKARNFKAIKLAQEFCKAKQDRFALKMLQSLIPNMKGDNLAKSNL